MGAFDELNPAPWTGHRDEITQITVAEGVTSIAEGAFRGLPCLASIRLPDSLETLGAYALADCPSLSGLDIPEGVATVPERLLSGCGALTWVSLPATLERVEACAFADCSALADVTYAGYEDEGESLIIDGDMIEAIPSIPPSNWLTIRVVCNAYRNTEMMSMSMISEPKWNKRLQAQNQKWGFRIDEILDRFVKYAGLDGWRISDSDPDEHMRLYNLVYGMYLRSFDCTGTRDDIIRELNRIGDFAVALDGRTLVVGPRPWLLNKGYPTLQQQVEYNSMGSRGQKKHMKIPVLDMEHGLVGIPQYKWPCCTMTTFLTCGTKIFDRVELKCRYNTEANGIYVVYGISYDGQLRGTPWYAKLHARADGVPLTDQEKAQMEQKTKEK
jgi:hypothetical protein